MSNRNTFAQRREDSSRSLVDPKDPRIPAAIIALQPRAIVAEDDEVFLDLHGGLGRYGVTAYSAKVAGSHSNGTNRWSGRFLLTSGLWFFDEELTYERTDRAEYINKLKAMKPDDAPTPQW